MTDTASRPRVLVVFGTRPEAIKMAPVVRELRARADRFETIVCATSQHRQMLRQVLDMFEVAVDFDLDIMKPNQDIYDITTAVLNGTKRVLAETKPHIALVHGDTTSCLAAALACRYANITLGHVEAGLRTLDKRQPFPEEINRRITDSISDIHFAPTDLNRRNLLAEGMGDERIHVTGNTVVDALLSVLPKARKTPPRSASLNAIDWSRRTILVTCHRRESFGHDLQEICHALRAIVEQHPNVNIVYPVHLNPNVHDTVHRLLDGVAGIHLIEPLEYLEFLWLMDRAHLVLTDSGGIQEEAPSLDKPVIVMRAKTERPEAVSAGAVVVSGTERARIVAEVERLLTDDAHYQRMAGATNPYGDGRASQLIVDALERDQSFRRQRER